MSIRDTETFLYWARRRLVAVVRCFTNREVDDVLDAGYCLDRQD